MTVEFVFNFLQKTLVSVENTFTQLYKCFVSGQHFMLIVLIGKKTFSFCFVSGYWIMVEYEKRIYPERNLIVISHITIIGNVHILPFHLHCPQVMLKMKKQKSTWFDDNFVLFYLLDSRFRFSSVSVVFDFNASVSDAAPMYPMLLSVYLMKMKKEWIIYGCHLCIVFLCVHLSDQVLWVLCSISVPHTLKFLLFLQSRYLLIYENRRVNCWWMPLVYFFNSHFK